MTKEDKAFLNAIRYFNEHGSIWFYDVIDEEGNKVLCSSTFKPQFKIQGLGLIRYYDKNKKHINDLYYN